MTQGERTIILTPEGETALMQLCAVLRASPDEVIELCVIHSGGLISILAAMEAAKMERDIDSGLDMLSEDLENGDDPRIM